MKKTLALVALFCLLTPPAHSKLHLILAQKSFSNPRYMGEASTVMMRGMEDGKMLLQIAVTNNGVHKVCNIMGLTSDNGFPLYNALLKAKEQTHPNFVLKCATALDTPSNRVNAKDYIFGVDDGFVPTQPE